MKRRRDEDAAESTKPPIDGPNLLHKSPQKKKIRASEPAVARSAPTDSLKMHSMVHDLTADAVANGELTTWHLAASRNKGRYAVLVFFPLAFTFVCPTELVGFSDRLADFDAIKCDVFGVSVDSKFALLAWQRTPRSEGGLAAVGDHQKPFALPLVSDLTHAISKSFDDVFDQENGHSRRAAVIISDTGAVREVLVNDDPVGRSVDEVLRLVQALQYADAHDGEACPANWTPGHAAIKADPVGSKEYFNTDMEVAHQQ